MEMTIYKYGKNYNPETQKYIRIEIDIFLYFFALFKEVDFFFSDILIGQLRLIKSILKLINKNQTKIINYH